MADSSHKSNWFKKHKILTVVLGILLLIIIGTAIGSGSNTPTVSTNSTSNTSSSKNSGSGSSSGSSSSSSQTAHVGDTVTIDSLKITLLKVIDPASGADQYTSPDAGKRFVALDFKIQNSGTASYTDDANNDATLIGSDSQSYTADFDNVSECTNFNSGQYTLASGDSEVGCVVYQVPDAVKTAKVQFQDTTGSTAQWLVP